MHRTLLLEAVDKYWRRFPKRLKIFTIHGVNFFQFFCREANNLCLDINIWFLLEPSHHRTNVVELYWNPGLIHKCDYWKFQKYSTIFFPLGSVKDGPPKALDTPDIIWNTAGLGSSHNKLLSRYSHFSGRCLRWRDFCNIRLFRTHWRSYWGLHLPRPRVYPLLHSYYQLKIFNVKEPKTLRFREFIQRWQRTKAENLLIS